MRTATTALLATLLLSLLAQPARADIIGPSRAACVPLRVHDGCITSDGRAGRCEYPPGATEQDIGQGRRDAQLLCTAIAAVDPSTVRNQDAAMIEAPRPSAAPAASRQEGSAPRQQSGCSAGISGESTGYLIVWAWVMGACALGRRRRRIATD